MDERARKLIDKWSSGAVLSEAEIDELRSADSDDAEERRVLSAFAELADRDRGVRQTAVPPEDLEARVMAAIGKEPGNAAVPTAARRGSRTWRVLRVALPAATLAAAVLVVGFLLGVGYARSTGPSAETAGLPAPDTITVTFRLAAPEAKSVALVGDFNNWQGDSFRMTNDNRDGVWEITIPLHRGHVYTYNFLIDGDRWISDPDSLYQVKDGFGGEKSVIQL